MAIGFEFCFGDTYQKLNSTVAGPYEKKGADTQKILLHLSDSICSDNEDALNEFIQANDSQFSPDDEETESKIDPSGKNIGKCRDFFDNVIHEVQDGNFDLATFLKSKEHLLSPLYTQETQRQKVFLVILNIVRPFFNCFQPKEELKLKLIKKYLKKFLIDQIGPSAPSFSGKTLPVVMHPEIFIDNITPKPMKAEAPFDWEQKRVKSSKVAPVRVFHIEPRMPDLELSHEEKQKVVKMDEDNGDPSMVEKDNKIHQAIEKGKVTQTQFLSMNPQQKLKAGLISQEQFGHQVFKDTDELHPEPSIEIQNIFDKNLSLKKRNFSNSDFNRYKIKGFDIDRKINELFKE